MTYSPHDYSQYRIERATQTLHEVEKHIENQFWNTAINRMYYACFYAVGALLVKHGILSLALVFLLRMGKDSRTSIVATQK